MNDMLWAPLLAMVCMACGGGDDGGAGGSGASGGSGGNGTVTTTASASTSGSGGTTGAGGSGISWHESCNNVTAERAIITPQQLLAALDNKDFHLINVHTPYAGEIVGTDTHIPFNDVDAIETYLGSDKAANVVLYCLTGPMSKQAGNALVKRGYCNIKDMAAGAYKWKQAGYPYTD